MELASIIQMLATASTVASKQADKVSSETALDVAYHIKTAEGYKVCGYNITYLKNGNVILTKHGKFFGYYSDIEFL